MPRPARVVHLIENLAMGGGIESVIWEFLRGMDPKRFQQFPWFLYQAGQSYERMREFTPETRFLNLPTYHRLGPLIKLAGELKEAKVDLIHLHGYFSGTFGRLVAPWIGLPWVYSLYSHYEDTYHWNNYFMERWLAKSRGMVVACSEVVREFAVKRCAIPPEKVVVNYEGITIADESAWPAVEQARKAFGLPTDAFVVGTVTRLYPAKNTDLLIRAAKGLPDSFHILIAGEGPELSALQQLANQLGLSGRVHFAGLVKNVALALQAMDLFVQTSKIREGFSIALIEAMAFGKPCAVTTIGGNVEAVPQDVGWWISPEDPSELHRVLVHASTHRGEIELKGQAARDRYLTHFTGRHMVRGMESIYERALGSVKSSKA